MKNEKIYRGDELMPHLSSEELKNLYDVRNKLSKDEVDEFMSQCNKIFQETTYNLPRRASAISALRLYLLAEKNFTLDQVVDLEKLPKNDLIKYMKEFVNYLNDPKLSKAKKVERIGKMHGDAFRKIIDSEVPNPGEVKSLENLAKVQKKMYVLGVMYIDSSQDMESITGSNANLPELKSAYYRGAGGQNSFEEVQNKWTTFSKNFENIYSELYKSDYSDVAKAALFDYTKDYFKKYGGKKISSLPTRESVVLLGVVGSAQSESMNYGEAEQNQIARDYLNGQAETYPGQKEIRQAIDEGIQAGYVNFNNSIEESEKTLSSTSMESYVSELLDDKQKELKDLTLLPKDKKEQMLRVFEDTFGKFYSGSNLFYISDYGKDCFDLITDEKGQSIREKAGNKYKDYDGLQQEEALKLEVVRALAVEKKGLKYKYVTGKKNGSLELSKAKDIKRVADSFSISIDADFGQKEVDEIYSNPEKNNQVTILASRLEVALKRSLGNQMEILDKYGLTLGDIFFVGNKSIRQLYNEMYPDADQYKNQFLYKYLVAASQRKEPVFMTAVSEVDGQLKRHVVPIVYTGQYAKNTKVKEMSANKKAGQKVVDTLPEAKIRKPIKVVNLKDILPEKSKTYPYEEHVGMLFSMYGAEQVMVNELVTWNTYKVKKFKDFAENMYPGSFSNEDFALVAYFAAMDPNSVKGDVWPEAGNDASNEEKIRSKHTFYTTDICSSGGKPRYGFWNHFYNPGIRDARQSTESAIEKFDEGDIKPLASIITAGIKMSCKDLIKMSKVGRTDGVAIIIVNMLDRMDKLITSKGGQQLRTEIENSLTAEEKKIFALGLKIKKLQDAKLEVDELLAKAERKEIVLSDEERQACTEYNTRYDTIMGAWEKNIIACEEAKYTDPEFLQMTGKYSQYSTELSPLRTRSISVETVRKALNDLNSGKYGHYKINDVRYETNAENAEEMKATFKQLDLSQKDYEKLKSDFEVANRKAVVENQRLQEFAKITIPDDISNSILNEEIKVSPIWQKHNPYQPEMKSDDLGAYRGRKVKPLSDGLLDDKYMDMQQYTYLLKVPFADLELNYIKETPDLYNKFYKDDNKLGMSVDEILDQVDDAQSKHGLGKDNIWMVSVPEYIQPHQVKTISEWVKELHDRYSDSLRYLPEEEKIFRPMFDMELNELDDRSGNILKAMNNNLYLRSLLTLCNFGPAIFREKGKENYISRNTVKERLEERGVLTPTLELFGSISQIVKAEYRRQQDEKDGWSNEKEQRYYYNLTKAYETMIKTYEELVRVPKGIQLAQKDAMEDGLTDIINYADNSNRGVSYAVGSMKWEIQAMKNGWHVDTIQAMTFYGRIDGNLETFTRRTEQEAKNLREEISNMPEDSEENINTKNQKKEQLNDLEKDLEELRRFEREKMAPFRKEMFEKKINSPEDVLDAMNIGDKFFADNKDLEIVRKYKVFKDTFGTNDDVLNKVNNTVIEDIKLARKHPKMIQEKYTPTIVPEYPNKLNEIINYIPIETNIGGEIVETELTANDAVNILQNAIKEQYLSQLYPVDHPEFFDKDNQNYKKMHKMLDSELKRYSREYIEKLARSKGQQYVEKEQKLVEAGDGTKQNVEGYKIEFKDLKIKGSELVDMIKYGHHQIFFTQLEDNMRIRSARNDYATFVEGKLKTPDGTQTTLNECLKKGLNKLNDAPETLLSSNIVMEAHTRLKDIISLKKSIDKDLKKKRELKQKCEPDPKKLENLKKKVATFLVGTNGYIKKKDVLRKIKHGNLGKNGEARYEAMEEAFKSVFLLKKSIDIFEQNIIQAGDHDWKPGNFGCDPVAEVNFINHKKNFIREDLNAAVDKVNIVYAAEDKKREELMNNPEASADQLIRSAQRTIYLDTVKSKFSKEAQNATKAEENLKHFNNVMNEYCKGKGESEYFKKFVDETLSNAQFKNEFSKLVIDGAKNGKVKTADILRYKNEALNSVNAAMERQNQLQNKKQLQNQNQPVNNNEDPNLNKDPNKNKKAGNPLSM